MYNLYLLLNFSERIQYNHQEYLCLLTESMDLLVLTADESSMIDLTADWINKTSFISDEIIKVGDTIRCTLGSLLAAYSSLRKSFFYNLDTTLSFP